MSQPRLGSFAQLMTSTGSADAVIEQDARVWVVGWPLPAVNQKLADLL